jgi:hypothetical protein
MSPGPPPNGAISATLDIGRPHRLQALCATTFIVRPLVVGQSLLPMRVKKWGVISIQFSILDSEDFHIGFGEPLTGNLPGTGLQLSERALNVRACFAAFISGKVLTAKQTEVLSVVKQRATMS